MVNYKVISNPIFNPNPSLENLSILILTRNCAVAIKFLMTDLGLILKK